MLFNASFAWCLQYRFYKVIEIIDTLFKFLKKNKMFLLLAEALCGLFKYGCCWSDVF